MLVLSRRQNEKIVFPNLGIRVEVVRISGRAVRIGVEAPAHVRILREEIADATPALPAAAPVLPDIPVELGRQMRHALRNRLNTAALGLQVLHRKIETGNTEDAEPLIFKVFNELHEIEAQLDAEKKVVSDQRGPRNRRALIVDDNPNEGQLLAEYLRMSGYDVEWVEDGSKAISYLKEQEHPDVVLLDMCMPQFDGPQTISSIRREPELQGLKVFAVSGADRHDLGVALGPRGVDRWFSKPVDARTLVSAMNRELDDALIRV